MKKGNQPVKKYVILKRGFNLVRKTIADFLTMWRYFGFAYAFYSFLWWINFYVRTPLRYQLSTFAIRRKTAWLDRYIGKRYDDILERYKTNPPKEIPVANYRIWVFWGQGEQQMPPLVRACYTQLTHFNANVTLVTNQNVDDYITLPAIVFQKVKDGSITWANFSDIVRNTLLAKYGGLWLDATVWVSGKLPFKQLSALSLFTPSGTVPVSGVAIRFWTSFRWNWSSWCLWTPEEKNLLFSFLSEMMQAIAAREKCWPDYVIQDYLIYYACCTFPSVRQAMENQPIECRNRNEFANVMNKPYDADIYHNLISTDFVFKLSFRTPWIKETPEGKQTFYGRILSDIIAPKDSITLQINNK